jgi:hypothetical protein
MFADPSNRSTFSLRSKDLLFVGYWRRRKRRKEVVKNFGNAVQLDRGTSKTKDFWLIALGFLMWNLRCRI